MTSNSEAHASPYSMNQLMTAGVVGGGLLLAIYFGNSIGASEGNPLSTAIKLILPLVLAYSVVSPKQGLYILLFETAYLDLIKRLMVIFGDIDLTDISICLAAAPLTLASICVGLFIKRALRKREVLENEGLLLSIVALLLSFVTVSAIRGGDGLVGKLQHIAESGSYITLIFVVPVLLPNMEEFFRFVRAAVFIYVPVALYGFWQHFFGIADFEVTYMLSGLSMLVKEMDDVKPRIFSTLNSNHVFSIVMAFCCAFCFFRDQYKEENARVLKNLAVRIAFQSLFAVSVFLSLRRTGWMVLAVVAICCFCFKSVIRTAVFYLSSITAIVLLFSNADFIDKNWQIWQSYLPGETDFQEQAFRIGTFTDRVHSYNSLLFDESLRSWFGLGRGNEMLVHDAIGETLVSYGFVGLAVVACIIVVGLYKFHALVFNHRNQNNFYAMVLLLSLIVSNLFASIVFQTHIVIFPANFFFWLCTGALFSLAMEAHAADAAAVADVRSRWGLKALGQTSAASQEEHRPLSGRLRPVRGGM